jgi:hypothetical protein
MLFVFKCSACSFNYDLTRVTNFKLTIILPILHTEIRVILLLSPPPKNYVLKFIFFLKLQNWKLQELYSSKPVLTPEAKKQYKKQTNSSINTRQQMSFIQHKYLCIVRFKGIW